MKISFVVICSFQYFFLLSVPKREKKVDALKCLRMDGVLRSLKYAIKFDVSPPEHLPPPLF